jgi:hypothetical protein
MLDFIRRNWSQFFVVGCVCGGFGILPDLDHIIPLLAQGDPVTLVNLSTKAGRPLHIPIFIISFLVCVYFGSYVFRLYLDASNDSREGNGVVK